MIDVRNVSRQYYSRTAVDNISFSVKPGEVVGFLGPNGAGKSTTMRMLTGYLPPTRGSIQVAGHDVLTDSIAARREIGYMPENVPLYTDMRIKEYLRFRGRLKGLSGKDLRVRVGDVMEQCGLTHVRRKMIGTLSRGYRQRVGLADSLIHQPKLLILDEPTNGLDPNQIRQVRDLIKSLSERHTVLLSTHILSEVEAVCDRVVIINEGKIKADDTPDNLVSNLRRAGTVFLEIKADPAKAEELLRQVPAVKQVTLQNSADGWHWFVIRAESGTDTRQNIARLCSAQGWDLRELGRKSANLEDVFVELTQRQF
ncbi:ATP-binding cassette domain-containing protein [Sulfuriroseicoccus oceanibius]|uniref:ATP-binding cassette domain-containing protein n=1 Tax=Sulfuriroseicoccus oceanibius TaxID=2707525 RepID=A0A6B3L9N2_9BACT|nr:ATP-binding cassette domain-containing protein [Sulfuriroseicoccus oceanibius]